jgi:tRNA nucleotidyltransferase (CCA-adding enzyme)
MATSPLIDPEVVLEALAGRADGEAVLALSGARIAVVGGFVRDSLLGREPREIDLVVEGDVAEVAAQLGGEVTTHEQFLAARVTRDGWSVDITHARSERYPHPGALPVVEPATLEHDLGRRDFTINAIAVTLDRHRLLAADGAARDLAGRRLRILHDESFLDDPTRVIRLARYSHRLGFVIEPHTAELAAQARLATLTGARIGAELQLALLEPDPLAPLADLTEQLPISVDRSQVHAALAIAPADANRDLVVLGAVMRQRASAEWIGALELNAQERDIVIAARRADEIASAIETARSASALRDAVRGAPVEVIAIAGALGPREAATRWLSELRHVKLEIDGDDLIRAGVVPGPLLGARLERTLRRKLDGEIEAGREAELRSALKEEG